MRFENVEAGVTAQVGRAFLKFGGGLSTIYELTELSLKLDGSLHCSGDPGDIEETSYQNTHHNWQDLATGTIEGVRYELYLGRELTDDNYGWAPTLSAFDALTGEVVLEPIPLTPTGGPISCWECVSHVDVIISEVMAHNVSTLSDENGEYEPWLELFNPSSDPVDLSGWTLSNDLTDRTRWTFPEVTIPRHGYLLVFADGQPAQGDLHTNFRLSPEGGAIILSTPSGITNGGQAFGPQQPNRSFGFTFGSGTYVWMPEPTPGTVNPDSQDL